MSFAKTNNHFNFKPDNETKNFLSNNHLDTSTSRFNHLFQKFEPTTKPRVMMSLNLMAKNHSLEKEIKKETFNEKRVRFAKISN